MVNKEESQKQTNTEKKRKEKKREKVLKITLPEFETGNNWKKGDCIASGEGYKTLKSN